MSNKYVPSSILTTFGQRYPTKLKQLLTVATNLSVNSSNRIYNGSGYYPLTDFNESMKRHWFPNTVLKQLPPEIQSVVNNATVILP